MWIKYAELSVTWYIRFSRAFATYRPIEFYRWVIWLRLLTYWVIVILGDWLPRRRCGASVHV